MKAGLGPDGWGDVHQVGELVPVRNFGPEGEVRSSDASPESARAIFLTELAPLIDRLQAGDETARPAMEDARRRYYEELNAAGLIVTMIGGQEIPRGDPRNLMGWPELAEQPKGEVSSEPRGRIVMIEGTDYGRFVPEEVTSESEPRRCTAPITVAGEAGEVEDECGAILGRDLHCQVCGGGLCYQHCAGVDHFGGRLLSTGAAGMLLWKIFEVAANRFRGQLYDTLPGGRLKILATSVGTSVDSVSEQIQWRIDQLVHQSERAAAAAAQTAVPLPILDFIERVPRGLPLGRDKRAELLEEVIAWFRGCEEQWQERMIRHPGSRAEQSWQFAKALHDRQVVELFARLAGAL